MKVVVTGIRGFPNVQGGIETHCEGLYPRLVEKGLDVSAITRTPYIRKSERKATYNGVKLKHIYAPRNKSLEAIFHTFLGVIYARLISADILHIQAIGPAVLVPFARLLGLRTVVTHHGPDYERAKWGKLAKFIIRLGEKAAIRFSNKVIVISKVITKQLEEKYGYKDAALIYYGITCVPPLQSSDYIESIGLKKKQFIIAVARFVEEKGFHDLLEAYSYLETPKTKLVLVGDADHETVYSKELKRRAQGAKNVVLTGFVKEKKLAELFSHAQLFVMPSYHEGLPIAMLEAMSYNLPLLVSDIAPHCEADLPQDCYFRVGNVSSLCEKLGSKLNGDAPSHDFSNRMAQQFNWDTVTQKTKAVYDEIISVKI